MRANQLRALCGKPMTTPQRACELAMPLDANYSGQLCFNCRKAAFGKFIIWSAE